MTDYSRIWYHGSPLELAILRTGSTITQIEALARVFSHKPTIVVLDDDPGGVLRLRHNGKQPGLLYVIDEPIHAEDVEPHPRSSMPPEMEWLTCHPLKLRLIGRVGIDPDEMLTEEDIRKLITR